MEELQGRTAVITGGASGMGRAMALRFADAAMNIVIGDVDDEAAAAVVSEVAERGAKAIAHHTDVADEAANAGLREAAIDAFGGVDVVCLNAGVTGSAGRSWALTDDDWRWSLGILLDGVIHGVRTFVPDLVDRGEGHVVFTASIAGHVSSAFSAPYLVAKHGVVSLAESLHHELKSDGSGVGVTCLCPGFVNTDIIAASKRRPEGAPGSPRDEAGGRWLAFSERFIDRGLDPEVVGDLVHDAIVANRFWLFTDEDWDAAIMRRAEEITGRLAPTTGRPS